MKEEKVRYDSNKILSTVEESNQFYQIITIGFMTPLVAMTTLISYLKTDSTKITNLEDSLVKAFCSALELSSINPKWREEGYDG